MSYIGLSRQIRRNNTNSILLLLAFPLILLVMLYALLYFAGDGYVDDVNRNFMAAAPLVLAGVAIWFLIAWGAHSALIRLATGAKPVERRVHKRVYNLLENLCISQGMKMPKLFVIPDDSLNAYASGIDQGSYAITLSEGIIAKLNDEELEGVIAHELSHIRNRDVRVLIISIIFVGIFAFLAEMAFRSLHLGSGRRSNRDG